MFNVLADSGATINILSEVDFKSLRPTPFLRPTKTVISGFGVKEATPVLGQFSTLLEFRSGHTRYKESRKAHHRLGNM